MGDVQSERGTATTIADLAAASGSLSLEEFIGSYGDAFFLHHGPLDSLESPLGTDRTLTVESAATMSDRPLSPQNEFLVFPVDPPGPDGSRADMIWLGRSAFNEVVVPDATVSEVHAFIRREEDGTYYIQDTGSRNGTWVGDQSVPAQGVGEPVPLPSGARVRIGTVRLTFLGAEAIRNLMTRLGH